MSDVRIAKQGLQSFSWDSELGQNVEEKVPTFLVRLRCACEIETGVTLGDIFTAVSRDRALASFLGDYSWCNVDAFHTEAEKPARASSLTRLELIKRLEIDSEYDAGERVEFHGVGPPDEELRKLGVTADEVPWGISLSPVNELVSLPVVLNHSASVTERYKEVRTASVSFTLLEVLSEIYFEISFHGSPDARDGFRDELHLRAAEVEAGTAETIPLEDVFGKETIQ